MDILLLLGAILSLSFVIYLFIYKKSTINTTMSISEARRNCIAYLIISFFTIIGIFKSLKVRHPWALTCYQCLKCKKLCPINLDPSRFVLAARWDYPELTISYKNDYITVKEASKICLMCRMCEKTCPLHLPITNAVMDLREDGRFGN